MDTEKKSKKISRVSFSDGFEKVQSNIPALFFTVLAALVIMFGICAVVFSTSVKGAEKVLVPNVVGEKLEDAILEMQVKELYPKISLRYTDAGIEKGVVLEQNPVAGAIVKGYSRVTLVVSRGPVEANVENYVGKTLKDYNYGDELAEGKKKSIISLASPIYKNSSAPEGTIIAQYPAAGTAVYDSLAVQLVVSKGAADKKITVPALDYCDVSEFLSMAGKTPVIFDVATRLAADDEEPGTVVAPGVLASEYARVKVDYLVTADSDSKIAYGVLEEVTPEYPVPVKVVLESISEKGDVSTLATISHTGGVVTIPYAAEKGSTLVLTVNNKVTSRVSLG